MKSPRWSALILGMACITPSRALLWSEASTQMAQSLPALSGPQCLKVSERWNSLLKNWTPGRDAAQISERELGQLEENFVSWIFQINEKLDQIPRACLSPTREILNGLHDWADLVGEKRRHVQHRLPSQVDFQAGAVPVLQSAPHFRYVQKGREAPLVPGDVLVTRGTSEKSALIAQLAAVPSRYSHIVQVAKDPRSQNLATIESYIGAKVGVYDMPFALKNENVRIQILRPRDRSLGEGASESAQELIRQRRSIEFDHRYDLNSYERLTCLEVARYSYDQATGGRLMLPQVPSQVTYSNEVLKWIGVKAGTFPQPGDMEIDARFEAVGDFTDLSITRNARHKDVALGAMLGWLNSGELQFKNSLKSVLARYPLHALRASPILWPLFKRTLGKVLGVTDYPSGFSGEAIAFIVLTGEVNQSLVEYLTLVDDAYEKESGWSATEAQLKLALQERYAVELKARSEGRTVKWYVLRHLLPKS